MISIKFLVKLLSGLLILALSYIAFSEYKYYKNRQMQRNYIKINTFDNTYTNEPEVYHHKDSIPMKP